MVKKAEKRGVKPGIKRGPYKKAKAKRPNKIIKGLEETVSFARLTNGEWQKLNAPTSVGNLPSLISQLASSIDSLEVMLTAQIDRIKSILV